MKAQTPVQNRSQFHTSAGIKAFLLAGRAIITLKSLKTNEHYTFLVVKDGQKDTGGNRWSVKVLSGQGQYTVIGNIRESSSMKFQRPLNFTDSPASKAFKWFWEGISALKPIPFHLLEVWHEGRCGRCGRPLTHPDSIKSGIGPECAGHIQAERNLEAF